MSSARAWWAILVGWACAGLASGCILTSDIDGNGVTEEEDRSVGAFDGVAAESMVDVDIEIGSPASVSVTCDSNLLRYIETFIEGGALVVSVENDTNIQPRSGCYATVVAANLAILEASGSGDIDCTGAVPDLESVVASGSGDIVVEEADGTRLETVASGSGNIDLTDVAMDEVDVASSGSGITTLKGTTDDVEIGISGSGAVLAKDLLAEDAEVDSSGSGDTEVYASVSIDITLSGSGDVDVWGSPSSTSENVTGSGSVSYH